MFGAFCTRGLRNDLSEKSGTGLTRKRNGEYQVRSLWRFQQMGPLCQVSGSKIRCFCGYQSLEMAMVWLEIPSGQHTKNYGTSPCLILFNGKIHYFYGHFQQQTISLPEGMLRQLTFSSPGCSHLTQLAWAIESPSAGGVSQRGLFLNHRIVATTASFIGIYRGFMVIYRDLQGFIGDDIGITLSGKRLHSEL